jgi:hypothetical protein
MVGGIMIVRTPEKPTKEEALEALRVMDGIFMMDALHHAGGRKPDPNIVKLFNWMEHEFNIERDERGNRS